MCMYMYIDIIYIYVYMYIHVYTCWHPMVLGTPQMSSVSCSEESRLSRQPRTSQAFHVFWAKT